MRGWRRAAEFLGLRRNTALPLVALVLAGTGERLWLAYLIRDGVVTTGSFLGAWLWSLGPRVNFAGAAVFGACGTWWFWWFILRKPPTPSSARK